MRQNYKQALSITESQLKWGTPKHQVIDTIPHLTPQNVNKLKRRCKYTK